MVAVVFALLCTTFLLNLCLPFAVLEQQLQALFVGEQAIWQLQCCFLFATHKRLIVSAHRVSSGGARTDLRGDDFLHEQIDHSDLANFQSQSR